MTTNLFRTFGLLAITAGIALTAHAQLPTDNPVWKTRCNVLAAVDANPGTMPAAFKSVTHGVSGDKFLLLAVESSNSGNHNVACALFYLAAAADRAGNGTGKPDGSAADTAAQLAASERKLIAGQSISVSDHLAWAGLKVKMLRAGDLSSDDTTAVLNAATTVPLSANPAPVATPVAFHPQTRTR